jgi:hypothetical protein
LSEKVKLEKGGNRPSGPLTQPPYRPPCRIRHRCVRVRAQAFCRAAQTRITTIADGIEDIADKPVSANAFDRALGKQGAEGRIIELG